MYGTAYEPTYYTELPNLVLVTLGFGFFHVRFHSTARKLFIGLEICSEKCTTASETFPMNVLKHYNLAVPVTLKGEQIAQSMVFEFLSQVDTSQVDVSQVDVSHVDKSLHI